MIKKMRWFVEDTLFFFRGSGTYMAGMRTTPLDWIRAYLEFMRLSWKDYRRGM